MGKEGSRVRVNLPGSTCSSDERKESAGRSELVQMSAGCWIVLRTHAASRACSASISQKAHVCVTIYSTCISCSTNRYAFFHLYFTCHNAIIRTRKNTCSVSNSISISDSTMSHVCFCNVLFGCRKTQTPITEAVLADLSFIGTDNSDRKENKNKQIKHRMTKPAATHD